MAPVDLLNQPSSDLSKADIEDLLADDAVDSGEDSEKVITDTEAGNKEVEPEKKEKEKEIPEEESKEEEEKIELKEADDFQYYDIPNRQAILKKFPELFKDFPAVERAIYGNQQFREIFPTVQDAKEAQQAVENYREIESTLLSGDIGTVLKNVKETDNKAFGKISGNIIDTIYKIDQGAGNYVTGRIISRLAKGMLETAARTKNEGLELAAKIVASYTFNGMDVEQASKIFENAVKANDEHPEATQLKTEKEAFVKQQYDAAMSGVSTKTGNTIEAAIDKHIDPRGLMTDYVKDKAKSDALAQVNRIIENDTPFRTFLDKLWTNAFNNNFDQASLSKINNAILQKARTILPGVIQDVKGKALKGQAARTPEASKSNDKSPVVKGRPEGSSRSSSGNKAREIKPNEKSSDYLMSDD